MANFQIRTMTLVDVEFAIGLAAQEGWNPGLHDAESFYRTDPHGFFVALLDGKPIGCISAVSYGGIFGFIGLYIMLPQYRGQGYGMQLWQHAFEYLKGHNIGLDGVVEQQPNYLKSGLKLAYRNIRYEATATKRAADSSNLNTLRELDFESLSHYDRRFFPVERDTFLKAWIAMPDASGLACVEQGKIKGYGVIRQCRNGYKIGPLFADTPAVAEHLFNALSASAEPGSSIYLDIPETNPEAIALVERHQMRKVFETARMYTGKFPALDIASLYGITTFELG